MQGIYIISCTQENYVYIGSSIDIKRRWMEHKRDLNKGVHHCSALQLAWDAYGDESFTFDVLEETTNLVRKEQDWLDKYANYYNTSKKVFNPMANPEVASKQVESLRLSGKRGKQILTEEQVKLIKIDLRDGILSTKAIAKKYIISQSTIAAIRMGHRWSHVKIENFTEGRAVKTIDYLEDIIKLKNEGLTHKQIADSLGIKSLSTITYALKKGLSK